MTTDDELRDALRARAGSPTVAAPAWNDVPARARRIHRQRRTFQGAVAAVAVVAVTFGLLAVTGAFDGDARRSIVAKPPAADGELVVALADRIVATTADGEIVRTLYEGSKIAGTLSVTPDGRFIYFSTGRGTCHEPTSIARVPVEGGAIEHVEDAGGSPLVSPDGRWLAWTSAGCTPTSQLRLTNFAANDAAVRLETSGEVVAIAWSPDSSRLLARSGSPSAAQWIEAGVPAGNVGQGPLFAEGVTAMTYADDGSLLGAFPEGRRYRVNRVYLPIGGRVEPRFAASGQPPTAMALGSRDRLLMRHSDGRLQLQEGSNQPHTVAEGVRSAAWIPRDSPVPTTSTTTTTTAPPITPEGLPARVIAHHADGRVLELEATSGQVLTEITNVVPAPPEATIAVTPDGSTIFAEWRTDNLARGCDLSSLLASEIVEIDRASGVVRPFLDTPARWPAVSPDGRFLAYVRVDRCDAPTSLVVRDLVDGGERVWSWPDPDDGRPSPQLRGPLSFGSGGGDLLTFVHRGSDVEAWVFDVSIGGTGDARLVPPVPPGPVNLGFHAQRYLGDSGYLGAATFGDVPNIYSLDPTTGMAGGRGIVWSSSGSVRGELGWTLVDSDRAAKHLLLIVHREDGNHLERVVTLDPSDRASSPRTRLGPDGIVAAAWAP